MLIDGVLEATSGRLDVRASITATNFHTLFTGQNLRLEIIGLVFTITGLAFFCLPLHDVISLTNNRDTVSRRAFAYEMTDLSNECIALCEQGGSMNDLLVCLLYENLVLLSKQHGDSSK